jgi:hypothetical protein
VADSTAVTTKQPDPDEAIQPHPYRCVELAERIEVLIRSCDVSGQDDIVRRRLFVFTRVTTQG